MNALRSDPTLVTAPLYQQIKDRILTSIASGEWPRGARSHRRTSLSASLRSAA